MTNATLEVGTRVRVNDQFTTPSTELDKVIKAVVATMVTAPTTPENTIVGKLGTVTELCDHECNWPVQVQLDDKSFWGEPAPFRADELDVVSE